MSLACQKNSYLDNLASVVKSCEPASIVISENGKKSTVHGFNIILDDTVLFPEGGGQPDDCGTINNIAVLRVTRKGTDALHFTETPVEPGSGVLVKVDWRRRFDHMQQHTGQHLITALADSLYGFKTTSWCLGETTSYIELTTDRVTAQELRDIETRVNEEIRKSVAVTVHVYPDKEHEDLIKFRCRGLPDDHQGPVRVIQLGDLDCNLCCGTHVSNLAHLQVVKLLDTERGKKGKTNLSFVVGDRVTSYLGRCVGVEKSLNVILSGPLDQHVELAEKMMKSFKQTKKMTQVLLREIAVKDVALYHASPDPDHLLSLHRKDGEMDYINAVVNEVNDENVVIFVTLGETSGLFFIRGEEELLKEIEPSVVEFLEAKGAVKKTRYQGKANKLGNWGNVERCIRAAIVNNLQQ